MTTRTTVETYHGEVEQHVRGEASRNTREGNLILDIERRQAANDLTDGQLKNKLAELYTSHKCMDDDCPMKNYKGHAKLEESEELAV